MKRTKWMIGVAALMLSTGAMAALAAETEPAAGSYSYLAGQERSTGRNGIYAEAERIEGEAEREAFLQANGIAETEYSEEAAASYSYVAGRARGTLYETSETPSDYSYVGGQLRGSSYQR